MKYEKRFQALEQHCESVRRKSEIVDNSRLKALALLRLLELEEAGKVVPWDPFSVGQPDTLRGLIPEYCTRNGLPQVTNVRSAQKLIKFMDDPPSERRREANDPRRHPDKVTVRIIIVMARYGRQLERMLEKQRIASNEKTTL